MAARGGETLVEQWMARAGRGWWFLLGLAVVSSSGAAVLALYLDGRLGEAAPKDWLDLLFFPLILTLVLTVQPLLRRRFRAALEELVTRIDLRRAELRERITRKSRLRGPWEWGPFLAGLLVGLALDEPWAAPYNWVHAVEAVFAGLACGLISWLVATSLLRTQLLEYLRRGAVTLRPLDPTVRWSFEVAGVLAALGLTGVVFLLNRPGRLAFGIYGSVLLLVVFGFLLHRVVAHLISSVHQSRIVFAVVLIVVTAAVGTIGYQLLEGWDLMDGLYMTVISMTTVGYGETRPLTTTGRIFTMLLVVASIGIAGYAISTVAGYVVEGELNRLFRGRRMQKEIAKLSEHVILCGAGRVGREIASEFYKTLTPFVIIEPKAENLQEIDFLEEIPYLEADATRDQSLKDAGVERASGMVAALHDDQSNLFLVLSARALNPKLRILARLADDANEKKLLRAGASAVVHPEAIGGLRMASMMIRPEVVTFLDQMLRVTGKTLRVEELRIPERLGGRTVEELNLAEASGLLTLALRARGRGGYEFNPPASTQVEEGDVLIVMGTPQQLRTARNL